MFFVRIVYLLSLWGPRRWTRRGRTTSSPSVCDRGPMVDPFQSKFLRLSPDGAREALHPDDISLDVLRELHPGGRVLRAVRAKCVDCCCGQLAEIRRCTAYRCPLWPYRMGSNPFYGAGGAARAADPASVVENTGEVR